MPEKFLQAVRQLESDYAPFGKADPGEYDCSCGCRHFVKLAHESGDDWGVCTNSQSPRSGMLTFEHQGCSGFEPITVDRNLTDSQLRHLIGEASQILHDRWKNRTELESARLALPQGSGEYDYDVRTSYFPHISGHFPTFFRIEWHDGSFARMRLAPRVSGKDRPTVKGRFPATNGDVFKIVRENGDYSYQVPFNGMLHNLKQRFDLSEIGLGEIELLRPFFENVESEVFELVVANAQDQLDYAKRWLEQGRDRLERWRRNEFWADEKPKNKRELREMIAEEEKTFQEAPSRVTRCEAFLEWLKGIDRSNPQLGATECSPVPKPKAGKASIRSSHGKPIG